MPPAAAAAVSATAFLRTPTPIPKTSNSIQSFLNSSSSGALSCLICLERIRPSDPMWSCTSLCFTLFHLLCIQSWARQASDLSAARAAARLPITAAKQATWNCPKSRSSYSKSEVPKSYLCFCGKLRDPPSDNPWILPHSCGEICNRSLPNNCGHFCLLLCHPGPCPSCPKSIKTRCFCGSVEDFRRCGFKNFSCNKHCNKGLDCNKHNCSEICHPGTCPLAVHVRLIDAGVVKRKKGKIAVTGIFAVKMSVKSCLTVENKFVKEDVMEEIVGSVHCKGEGHALVAKKFMKGCPVMGWLQFAVQLVIRIVVAIRVSNRGRVFGHFGFTMIAAVAGNSDGGETAISRTKSRSLNFFETLTRQACRLRCCDGDCPRSEVCDKRLRCKNHKCSASCHRGACAPCPLMVTISCACGETHSSNNKPHRCHYGPCPQCRALCEEEYPCGHKCNLRCHGPRPPPNPEFTLKPKKKKSYLQPECTPATPCPPCPELVWRPCVGEHMGAERMMVCSNTTRFSCDNLCGNLLPCGNHYCTKTCHPLETHPSSGHHKRKCPPCKVLVKRSCHCGAMVHAFECIYYNNLSEKDQVAARSCGGPCHRKLPNCTHLCPEICHVDKCPTPDKCSKKVTVRCKCQTLKKEWICQDVQAAYRDIGHDPKDKPKNQFGLGLLPCNSDCKRKVQEVESALQLRKPKVLEKKEPETEKQGPKRRKRRDRIREGEQVSRLQKFVATIKRVLLFIIIIAALIAIAYYGFKVLLRLSDWMNEIELQRAKQRRPPI
ncbi:NF-X1-type zinc finger protein NFXL2 [Hibiscus syriacus]|uniref:NF-X1-type zinc finger protein NFXL2 n=1 Tax=Hibiscus syriacus TaxID=106335 RepID=A0A6A3C578_HIBSY|nr:NF-X1-type zinc finger protein NFXL2 [Hibiscus syriacus]